jgi:hypothetical protein
MPLFDSFDRFLNAMFRSRAPTFALRKTVSSQKTSGWRYQIAARARHYRRARPECARPRNWSIVLNTVSTLCPTHRGGRSTGKPPRASYRHSAVLPALTFALDRSVPHGHLIDTAVSSGAFRRTSDYIENQRPHQICDSATASRSISLIGHEPTRNQS